MSEEAALREKAATLTRMLNWQGTIGMFGHASVRVPGFDAVGWTLICAPSATPAPIIDRLHKEITEVAASAEIRALIERLGTVPVEASSPAELQKFLASEIDRWGDLIERAGLAKSQ